MTDKLDIAAAKRLGQPINPHALGEAGLKDRIGYLKDELTAARKDAESWRFMHKKMVATYNALSLKVTEKDKRVAKLKAALRSIRDDYHADGVTKASANAALGGH